MRQAGVLVLAVVLSTAVFGFAASAGSPADQGTAAQLEKPAAAPVERDPGYRPRWADPDAKPPEPGIENDPTPFDPSEVDANSDTLNNNINPVDPD